MSARRFVADNPTWGAPRIHGELLKLGFDLSERSVSQWIRRAPRDPDPVKQWLTFLRNHREAIAAMDFFTVPTLSNTVLPRTAIGRASWLATHVPHSRNHIGVKLCVAVE